MELKCPYHGNKYMRFESRSADRSREAYRCDVCGYTVIQCVWPHMETEALE